MREHLHVTLTLTLTLEFKPIEAIDARARPDRVLESAVKPIRVKVRFRFRVRIITYSTVVVWSLDYRLSDLRC